MPKQKNMFTKFSSRISDLSGSSWSFMCAFLLVAGWAITGPIFDYSETWQLFINTATTILTFLMVFLIQSTQNRDTKALHIKLDELIRVTEGAHTALMDLEELSEQEIKAVCIKYSEIAKKSRELMRQGIEDTHIPDLPDFDAKNIVVITETTEPSKIIHPDDITKPIQAVSTGS